ncbi:hypothetical protein VTN00DRAFT_1105 [Thermoascus crustaceus]|uniref:uncharacterized protein n=1 Tax=Thermoascus crustaceus TaxID=5088 RepID=UPI00374495A1
MTQKQSPRQIPPQQSLSKSNTTTTPFSSPAARWRATLTRDTAADNTFVYAVRTTGIYCRPSCPARLARRANIEFYDSPAQAEAAGFRACKRCRPQQLPAPADPQIQMVQKACEMIAASSVSGERTTLQGLAAEANLTPSHFHRVFKKVMGVTPGQYAKGMRNRNHHGEKTSLWEEAHSLERSGNLGLLDLRAPNETNEALHDFTDWNEFDAMIAAADNHAEMQGSTESDKGRLLAHDSPSCLKIDSQIIGTDLLLGDDPALFPTQFHEPEGELINRTEDIVNFSTPPDLWKGLDCGSNFSRYVTDHDLL